MLPRNKDLPFFAYGFFKKNELAYSLIKDDIDYIRQDSIKGKCYDKDGIPIIIIEDRNSINNFQTIIGDIIKFNDGKGYDNISFIEPDDLYCWKEKRTDKGILVNILVSKINDLGNSGVELYENKKINWSGKDDLLFSSGMEYLKKKYYIPIIQSSFNPKKFVKGNVDYLLCIYFELQMSYVFLWSIIDRYLTLKYSLKSKGLKDKNRRLASDKNFKECIDKLPLDFHKDKVYDSSSQRVKEYHEEKGYNCFLLDLFYQVRCNSVHRGKALRINLVLLEKCFIALFTIMHTLFFKELKIDQEFNALEFLSNSKYIDKWDGNSVEH